MPARTNLFQQVITALYEHIKQPGQDVRESRDLPHSSGVNREVDVVIEGELAGLPIVVAVEATATRRKAATLPWAEELIKKHEEMPTHQLILVSEAGFTKRQWTSPTESGS